MWEALSHMYTLHFSNNVATALKYPQSNRKDCEMPCQVSLQVLYAVFWKQSLD